MPEDLSRPRFLGKATAPSGSLSHSFTTALVPVTKSTCSIFHSMQQVLPNRCMKWTRLVAMAILRIVGYVESGRGRLPHFGTLTDPLGRSVHPFILPSLILQLQSILPQAQIHIYYSRNDPARFFLFILTIISDHLLLLALTTSRPLPRWSPLRA